MCVFLHKYFGRSICNFLLYIIFNEQYIHIEKERQ